MAIRFHVAAGTILLCDYAGFRAPEMIKRRPVVAISPRLRHRDGLCTVVPLSLSAPEHEIEYQVKIRLEKPLPGPWSGAERWVKADLVAAVSFDRLDLFHTPRDQYGRRQYLQPKVTQEQLVLIQCAVLHGLGLGLLTNHLRRIT